MEQFALIGIPLVLLVCPPSAPKTSATNVRVHINNTTNQSKHNHRKSSFTIHVCPSYKTRIRKVPNYVLQPTTKETPLVDLVKCSRSEGQRIERQALPVSDRQALAAGLDPHSISDP